MSHHVWQGKHLHDRVFKNCGCLTWKQKAKQRSRKNYILDMKRRKEGLENEATEQQLRILRTHQASKNPE